MSLIPIITVLIQGLALIIMILAMRKFNKAAKIQRECMKRMIQRIDDDDSQAHAIR